MSKVQIIYEIDEYNLVKFQTYKSFIDNYIHTSKKIPVEILEGYFSLITNKEEQIKKELDDQIPIIKQATLNRFLTNKYYNPNKYDTEFKFLIHSICISLHKQLSQIWVVTDHHKRKSILINLTYLEINKHLSIFKHQNKHFSTYKKYVLTGFIVWTFGFYLSQKLTKASLKDKKPTNQQLYESVCYHLTKSFKSTK